MTGVKFNVLGNIGYRDGQMLGRPCPICDKPLTLHLDQPTAAATCESGHRFTGRASHRDYMLHFVYDEPEPPRPPVTVRVVSYGSLTVYHPLGQTIVNPGEELVVGNVACMVRKK